MGDRLVEVGPGVSAGWGSGAQGLPRTRSGGGGWSGRRASGTARPGTARPGTARPGAACPTASSSTSTSTGTGTTMRPAPGVRLARGARARPRRRARDDAGREGPEALAGGGRDEGGETKAARRSAVQDTRWKNRNDDDRPLRPLSLVDGDRVGKLEGARVGHGELVGASVDGRLRRAAEDAVDPAKRAVHELALPVVPGPDDGIVGPDVVSAWEAGLAAAPVLGLVEAAIDRRDPCRTRPDGGQDLHLLPPRALGDECLADAGNLVYRLRRVAWHEGHAGALAGEVWKVGKPPEADRLRERGDAALGALAQDTVEDHAVQGVPPVAELVEGETEADRGQLGGIADQDQARVTDGTYDAPEGGEIEHGGLVDHHDRGWPGGLAVPAGRPQEEARDGARRSAGRLGHAPRRAARQRHEVQISSERLGDLAQAQEGRRLARARVAREQRHSARHGHGDRRPLALRQRMLPPRLEGVYRPLEPIRVRLPGEQVRMGRAGGGVGDPAGDLLLHVRRSERLDAPLDAHGGTAFDRRIDQTPHMWPGGLRSAVEKLRGARLDVALRSERVVGVEQGVERGLDCGDRAALVVPRNPEDFRHRLDDTPGEEGGKQVGVLGQRLDGHAAPAARDPEGCALADDLGDALLIEPSHDAGLRGLEVEDAEGRRGELLAEDFGDARVPVQQGIPEARAEGVVKAAGQSGTDTLEVLVSREPSSEG